MLAATTACGETAIDVVAVWVDGVSDDQGNRKVRLYDTGEREILPVRPDIPGSSIDLLEVGVDSRARGVAVSGTDATVWVERGSGRRVTLHAGAVDREELVAPYFSFTRNGDGLMRALELDSGVPTWLFAPLSGPQARRVSTVEAPHPTVLRWSLRHATDAPVLVWAEIADDPSRAAGTIVAIAYPSEEGEGPWVEELRPLGRGTIMGAGVDPEVPGFLDGCPDRLCMSPSGRQVVAMVLDGGCDLWRWSWVEAESTGAETQPERVPLACPGEGPAALTAVLDDDLVVFDDPLRLYLVDLAAGSVSAIPKPGGTLVPYQAGRGRVLIVSSSDGELVRIDADGPRIVSGIQTPCFFPDRPAVSPSGTWVVQSCNGQGTGIDGVDGQVRRISVLGVELYGGIPMRPIAVDDEGNALLYSIASDDDDGTPRGLFVLTGDGQLARVDELEPSPGRVMVEEGEGEPALRRFAAAGGEP